MNSIVHERRVDNHPSQFDVVAEVDIIRPLDPQVDVLKLYRVVELYTGIMIF